MMPSVIALKLPKCHFKNYNQKGMKSSHQARSAVFQKEVPCPLTSAPLKAARKSDIQINSASPRNTGRNEKRRPQTGCLIRPHPPVASDGNCCLFHSLKPRAENWLRYLLHDVLPLF